MSALSSKTQLINEVKFVAAKKRQVVISVVEMVINRLHQGQIQGEGKWLPWYGPDWATTILSSPVNDKSIKNCWYNVGTTCFAISPKHFNNTYFINLDTALRLNNVPHGTNLIHVTNDQANSILAAQTFGEFKLFNACSCDIKHQMLLNDNGALFITLAGSW